MADVLAIVSKAIFEKAAGKAPQLGTRLQMDRYVSTNKALEPLAQGGTLYLVTVRPPDEALWLVAILERPAFDGKQWIAAPSSVPLTDISHLRSQITFESGTGITAKKGALGMSLQTPRALTATDSALLDAAAGVVHDDPDRAIPPPPATPSAFGAATGERRGSLLDAVLESPDSDAARQVYADQLMANNDPRGELIHVDIALAGPLSIRKREHLARRRKELIAQHAHEWWPYSVAASRVHKGFLSAIAGTWEQIAAVAPKLFAAEPVVDLELRSFGDDDELEALLAAPWLARIRRLVVRGTIGDEGFARLAKSKRTANLRALNVTANELGGEALASMKSALPRCETLVLTGNPIGDDGVENLREWKQLASVHTLYLSGCDITADGLAQLFAKATPSKLARLTLNNNNLDDPGAEVLAEHAAKLPALEHLEVMRCGISAAGATALATAEFPRLKRLDLRSNSVPAALAADPRLRT